MLSCTKEAVLDMFSGVIADGRWKCVTQIALITQIFNGLRMNKEMGRLGDYEMVAGKGFQPKEQRGDCPLKPFPFLGLDFSLRSK